VEGISQACVSNPDDRLFKLLTAAIDECKLWMPAPSVPAPPAQVDQLRRDSVQIR
jgi:hypothetical protein